MLLYKTKKKKKDIREGQSEKPDRQREKMRTKFPLI